MPALLPDCPPHPHCVSSLAQTARQRVAPLQPASERDNIMALIADTLGTLRGMRIVYADAMRIEAVATTLLLRFQDDVTLALDSTNRCIQIRSCSRVGHYDFGANRRRVEYIRRRLRQEKLIQ